MTNYTQHAFQRTTQDIKKHIYSSTGGGGGKLKEEVSDWSTLHSSYVGGRSAGRIRDYVIFSIESTGYFIGGRKQISKHQLITTA